MWGYSLLHPHLYLFLSLQAQPASLRNVINLTVVVDTYFPKIFIWFTIAPKVVLSRTSKANTDQPYDFTYTALLLLMVGKKPISQAFSDHSILKMPGRSFKNTLSWNFLNSLCRYIITGTTCIYCFSPQWWTFFLYYNYNNHFNSIFMYF